MYNTDFPVGKKQAMFTIDVHPRPNGLVCYPKHSLTILGVDSLGHRREFNWVWLLYDDGQVGVSLALASVEGARDRG